MVTFIYKVYVHIVRRNNMTETKTYSFDSCVIRKIIENPNYLNCIKMNCDFSNSTVLLSETAEFEIKKHLDKLPPGSTIIGIVERIKKDLKCDVEIIGNSQEVEQTANLLLELYSSKGLHYPDNLHMAFSVVHKTILLSCDYKLIRVCEMNKTTCINTHTLATSSGSKFVRYSQHAIEQVRKFKPKIESSILKPGEKITWRSYA